MFSLIYHVIIHFVIQYIEGSQNPLKVNIAQKRRDDRGDRGGGRGGGRGGRGGGHQGGFGGHSDRG